MRKVFLAIPSYSGKLREATKVSVSCFNLEAASLGWNLQDFRWHNDSLIPHARNACLGKFMESDCTDLWFLDDDVAVGPGVFTRLMSHPVDVVAAIYRIKKDEETYAVNYLPGNPEPDPQTGLLEMSGIPFGMVRIKRAAIEAMIKAYPDEWYMASCAKDLKTWNFFNLAVENRQFIGEDMFFCRKYRQIGGRVWVDTEIPIQHISQDDRVYPGHFGNWLRKHKAAQVAAQVEQPALKVVA